MMTKHLIFIRNNIFINNSTPNGTGLSVSYRRSGTSLASYNTLSNNNLFYSGTPGPNFPIYNDGTTSYQDVNAFKGIVSPREASSVTENTTFASTAGANSNYLHISTSVATQAESGGVEIPGITDDFDGDVRQSNPNFPDIGADEGDFIKAEDQIPPTISFLPLPPTCATSDRTMTATITDGTGVPTSGSKVPDPGLL